jgi:hypothetical protein
VVISRGAGTALHGAGTRRTRPGAVARAVMAETNSSVLLLCPAARVDGPVLVAYDGSRAAEQALLGAADIAEADGGRVVVAFGDGDAKLLESLRDNIAERLAARGLGAAFLVTGEVEGLAEAARRFGASVVVVSAEQALGQGENLEALLASLETSLLLLR